MFTDRRKNKFRDTGLKPISQQKQFDKVKEQLKKIEVKEQTFKTRVLTEINKTYQEINNIKDIFLPDQNQQIRIITNHTPADVFLFKIAQAEKINYCLLIVYSINRKSISKLSELKKTGGIGKIDFVLSHAWAKLQTGDYAYLKMAFPESKIKIVRTHCKIFLAQTQNNYFVCEGSGNFSRNTNYEQYIFENNPEAFNFHLNWVNNLKIAE